MPPKEVTVAKLPPCDRHPDRRAKYDFATTIGPWMYGCEACFRELGRGLGTGLGQKLVVKESPSEAR